MPFLRFLTLSLFFGMLLGYSSCSPETKDCVDCNKAIDTVLDVKVLSKREMLEQRWTDARDSAHVIILFSGQWHDLYNGDTVSVRPFELYKGYPDKGGKLSEDGDHLLLEESPGNFYDFLIRDLDSFRLQLYYVAGDLEQHYVRIP